MESIGGYFGLELRGGVHYHSDALKLNTARNCFEYILRAKSYGKVYLPYYTCDVMIEPIKKLSIDYEFYSIDEKMDPIFNKKLQYNEAFLYTNYFGLKQNTTEQLAERFGMNLIIDNSQAFFSKPINGLDTFYSARKFFGVPDGAYLYTDTLLHEKVEHDYSFDRISHLVKRIDCSPEKGFLDFKKAEEVLNNIPIRKMSKLTDAILCAIDYESIKERRRENYSFLERKLKGQNLFHFKLMKDDIPLVYPFLTDKKMSRERLISNNIYVATYWPNVIEWCNGNQLEYKLANQVIPLPIDQRYDENEMEFIVSRI